MIDYIKLDLGDIKEIKELWEKLSKHHKEKSVDFKHIFEKVTFDIRIISYLNKVKKGKYSIDVVVDSDKGVSIGYGMNSISEENIGEVDSIYIDPEYRGFGIGDELMRKALLFFEENKAKKILLGIAVGNEEVLEFYNKYGFKPRTIILEKK
ncbi:GNAT family N-acetyltransferase [Mycoplasmatota bacterium WC44]